MDKQVLTLGVATVVILGTGAYFAFSQAGQGSSRTNPGAYSASMSNAKQVALGFLMYATDYDDRLPPDMADMAAVKSQVDPYLKNYSLWDSLQPAGASFIANEHLSNTKVTHVLAPATEVLIYETREWSDGRRIVGYLDGHVRGERFFDPATDLLVDLTTQGQAAQGGP